MRLSHLLFLAIGIAVGLAIGMTVERDRSRAPRGTQQTAPPKTKGAPAAPAPQAERTRPESSSVPIRVRRADTPTGSAKLPEGMGVLELLWTGAPEGNEAWLSGTDLVGERETLDLGPKDPRATVTRTTLLAGEYLVFLEVDGELGPRTWPVTIRPGSITSVDFGAPLTPDLYPIPSGLGRLDFTAYDLDGEPFPNATVRVFGKGLQGEEVEDFALANLDGQGRLHLKPGPYEIQLGSQQRRVVIRAGETLEQVFRYQDEGEVRFRAASMGGKLSLAPEGNEAWKRPPYESKGWEDRFYYVRPGSYRLLLQTGHRQKPLALGRVVVHRGRVAIVEYTKPKGTIQLRVRHPVGRNWTERFPILVAPVPADPARPPERFGDFGPSVAAQGDAAWMLVTHFRPGRYRVTFTATGWETVSTELEVVGETPAEVLLETRPQPR